MAVVKFPDEISAIREMLLKHPDGLTIRSISDMLGMNRNSTAKYLEMLQMQGGVTFKRSGPSKIYCLANKLPAAAVLKLTKSHVIIFDQVLEVADINDSFMKLLKISKKEIIGKPLDHLPFAVQCQSGFPALITDGIRGNESRISGSIDMGVREIPCLLMVSPVFFENGNNGVSLIIDLKEPDNGDISNNCPDDSPADQDVTEYICRFAPDWTLTYVNSAYCNLLHKVKAELIGHTWHPTIPESEFKKIKTCLRSLEPFNPVTSVDLKAITQAGDFQWQRWKFRHLSDRYGKFQGIQGTGFDITELKKFEQKASKISEEMENLIQERKDEIQDLNKQIYNEITSHEKTHFQLQFTQFAMDKATYMIMWASREGRFIYMNFEAQRILGYQYRDVITKKFQDIIGGIFPFPWDDIWDIIKKEPDYTLETQLRASDNKEIPVEMVLNFLEFKDKQYCCCFARDITGRKLAEEALKESEQKYRDIFEKSVLGLFKSTPDGKLIDANDAFARMYGYSDASEILAAGLNIGNDLYADLKDRIEVLRILAKNGKIENYETQHLKRDGTRFWISITARTIRNKDGEVVVYDGTYVDISERKLAEEALKKSEARYKNISEATTDFVFSCSNTDNGSLSIEWMAGAVERITGYTIDELFAMKCWRCLVLPEDTTVFDKNVTDIPAGSSGTCQLRIRTKNGTVRWLSVNTTHMPAQEPMSSDHIFGGCKDITELKKADEALELQSKIVQNLAEGVVLISANDGKIVYSNPRFEQMFGYDPDELNGKPVSMINAPDTRSSQTIADEIISNLRQTGVWNGEVHNLRKDGTVFWCHATVSTFDHPQYGQVWVSVHMDITRRKLAEEALRNREHDFSTLVENATDMIVRFDAAMRYIYCNPAVERQLGIPFYQLRGKTPLEFGTSVEQSRFIDASLQKTLGTGIEHEVEQSVPTPKGLRHFLTRIIPERDEDGSIVSLLAITRDITDRKRAEELLAEKSRRDLKSSSENLQRSETDLQIHQTELEAQNEELRRAQRDLEVSHGRYFELYDLAPAGYLTLSEKGLVVNANLTVADLLGVERSYLIEKPISRFLVKEDQDIFYQCRNDLIETGERQSCELRVLRRGGLPIRVQMVAVLAQEVDGDKAAISLMVIDIAAIRHAKDALQTNEWDFHIMFNSHASVMLLIEPETGLIIDANRAAERFYGRSIEELCTLSIDAINTLSPEEAALKRKMAVSGEVSIFVLQHRLFNGKIRTVEVHSSPVTMGKKTVLFAIIHDITDRETVGTRDAQSPAGKHGPK